MKTVIANEEVRKMDLGEASSAYDNFDKMRLTFSDLRDKYVGYFTELEQRGILLSSKEEEDKLDGLAQQAEAAERHFAEVKGILSQKHAAILSECQKIHAYLSKRDHYINDGQEARSLVEALLSQARQLKEKQRLPEALEKAYTARESLAYLSMQAKKNWIAEHSERIQGMKQETGGELSC